MLDFGRDIVEHSPWLIPIIFVAVWYFILRPYFDSWSTDKTPILPPPKKANRALQKLAINDELMSFVKEYRRLNPDLSIQEARADFKYLRGDDEVEPSE
jgi:hypothetical protein